MDKMTCYRQLIMRLLQDFADLCNRGSLEAEAETVCIFDTERDQYMVANVGWQSRHRLRGTPLYLRLRNGKIWIEEDWTEGGIANDLLAAAVPHEDIVLAFHSPEKRALTEFAVA